MTAEQESQQQKRQVAYKVRVKDLVSGEYIVQDGWKPNYVKTVYGNVSRANIMATVVNIEAPAEGSGSSSTLEVDDGSNVIMVRSFENDASLESFQIGNTVLIIGRPREFNNSIYMVPEIIKTIEPTWLQVRKLELEKNTPVVAQQAQQSVVQKESIAQMPTEEVVVEQVAEPTSSVAQQTVQSNTNVDKTIKTETASQESLSGGEKVLEIIQSLDDGSGADFESVIQKSGFDDAEKTITRLMENGEIFEVRPGKLKVL
ncbi:hypothetical protein GOV04_05800 [Candidatus Woesearchaeota archaeon]|nr:hypothetical protein [Candidatus Woesearchaeota archaeon]